MANLATINNNILADSGIDPLSLIVGTGTVNYVPKFSAEDTIANSQITDNGSTVGINAPSATNTMLAIRGDWVSGYGTVRAYPVTAIASGGAAGYTIFDSNGTTRLAFLAVNSGAVEVWGQANKPMHFGTNDSLKMVLSAAGNLGINQQSPAAKLEIYPGSITSNANQEIVRLDVPGSDIFSSATGYINFRGYDVSNSTQRDVAWIGAQLVPNAGGTPWMGGNLIFRTTASGSGQTPQERMVITSEGLVGVNSTPTSILDIGTGASNALAIGNTSTTISSGDLLGAISFISRDGSTYSSGGIAGIRSYATATYNTGNVSADLRFYVSNSLQNTTAAVLFGTERMRLKQDGVLNVSAYGSGSITGTRAYDLAVDSSGNIIEVAVGAGTVTGSGTTNYLTKWTGSSSVGNSGITDDGTTITTAEALLLTGTSGYNITSYSDIIMANAKPVRGYTTGGSGYRLISIEADNNIHIAGNGGNIIMNGGGILGVGTASPTSVAGVGIEIYENTNGGTLSLSRDAGNQRGILRFGRNNGGSFQTAARIVADSEGGTGANGSMYFQTANSASALANRMIILSSGRIAINDTTANGQLQITGAHVSGYGLLNINSSDSAIIAMDGTTWDVRIRYKYQGSDQWFWGTTTDNTMRLTDGANADRLTIAHATGNAVFSGSVTVNGAFEAGKTGGAVTAGDLSVDTTSTASKVIIGRLSSTGSDNTVLIGRNRVGVQGWSIDGFGLASFSSSVTANSFIKSGGTSAQYLKADGSVSTLTNPVTGTGVTQAVAYWTSTSEIGAEADFAYEAANNRVRINSNAWDTAGAEAKLIVSGVLSAGSSAVAQFNGFVRIKDQLLIHNGANTAQDAYIQCIGSGVLTVGNTLLINTSTVVSGYNFQVNDQSWLNNMSIGKRNAAATSTDYPWIFLTDGAAGGIRPSEYGHVFIQSRSSANRGIGFITGTTPTERMFIVGSTGWIGMGTNDPQGNLEVIGLSYFTRAGKSFLVNPNYGGSNVKAQLQAGSAMALALATNGDNDRVIINSTGEVGINCTPANTMLQIQGDWVSGYSTLRLQGSASNQVGIGLFNTSGQRRGVWAYSGTEIYFETENSSTPMNFYPNGTSSMVLAGNGEISIGRATSGVTQRDIYINPTSGSPALYIGRLSSTNDDNTKVYFQNRVGQYSMYVDNGGRRVGIRTTTPSRVFHADGGYFMTGGDLYSSYTSNGLWGATALPNFLQTTGYGGSYSFNGSGGLILGYEDNGAGLYSPAYGFEVKSTDGIPVAGRVVRSIVMKDIDRNTYPLIIYNNGKTFMGEGAGYGRLDVSTSTDEAICVGVNSTTVVSGDLIGAISFVSRDGSTYSAGGVANIRSYATTTYNTGNVSADLRFYVSNSLQNTGNVPLFGTERMRIHSSGRVAVGESVGTANGYLQVTGEHVGGYGLINMNSINACILAMDSSGSYDIRIRYKYNGSDKWFAGMINNENYVLETGAGTDVITATQGGDVYLYNRLSLNTTDFGSSSAKFLVGTILSSGSGAIAQFNGFLRIRDQIIIHRDSNTAHETYLQCTGNAALTTGGSITATGFFESSDVRLKSNISDYNPINISEIAAKVYEKDGKLEIGYLAQDLQGVLDSAISERENGMLDLSYRQVHTAKIAALEARIKELESQLKNK